MAFFTIIVKSTSNCNLQCSYCYANSSKNEEMSYDTMYTLLKEASKLEAQPIIIVWHGGEPLLRSIKFYKKALAYQNWLLKNAGVSFINRIQTNGTLITHDYAHFFFTNNFGVGISIDGPPEIHNRNRTNLNGLNSYDKAIKGYQKLRRVGIKPGILSVLSFDSFNYIEEYAKWIHHNGFHSLSFNLIFNSRKYIFDQSWGAKYTKFLLGVEEACHNLGTTVNIRELISARQVLGISNDKLKVAQCNTLVPCFLNHSVVDTNGDVYTSCDRLMYSTNGNSYRIGRLEDGALKSTNNNPHYKELSREYKNFQENCKKHCRLFEFCPGSCVADILLNKNNNSVIPSETMSRCHVACISSYLKEKMKN